MLSLRGLTCRYGDRLALDGLSMTLEAGEIVGITGLPGAGTSTLIKAIMRLVAPQAGEVLIMDRPHDLASSRAQIAYLPQTIRPPGHLSGYDFIRMTQTLHGGLVTDADTDGLAGDVDLDPGLFAHPIRRYAKDDVQKLALVALFAAGRPILLLDRPMSDLETSARAGLRHRLKKHAAEGGAVLIGSPCIEDHQNVVDRLLMLNGGQLTGIGPMKLFSSDDKAA